MSQGTGKGILERGTVPGKAEGQEGIWRVECGLWKTSR